MKELHSVDIEVHQDTKLRPKRNMVGQTEYHECNFKLMFVVGPSGDCDVEVSENVIKRSG